MAYLLHKKDWLIQPISLSIASPLITTYHYSHGHSNTATYLHGLFTKDNLSECLGVAWWIPPTKSAAQATYPENWKGVLCLSRLVLHPSVPKNGCSFLLSKSMKMIGRRRWPCLVTYADTWQSHTGMIYRATNWQYAGITRPEPTYTLNGRLISRKAGPKTRSVREMLALGCVYEGRYSKHKYIHIAA